MDPIERPANVYVPSAVQYRIDARRAVASGDRKDMLQVVEQYGLDVPKNASTETLTAALLTGNTQPAPAHIAQAPTATAPQKGGS